MSYLAISDPGESVVQQVTEAVRFAGGSVVQAWPEIGVTVAHSRSAAFRDRLLAAPGRPVRGVGATRTAPVTEGTPVAGGLQNQNLGIPSATDRPQRSRPPSERLEGEELSPKTAALLTEGTQWDMQQIKADRAWSISQGSREVEVAVLDSGIDSRHPDLAPNLDLGSSVDCTVAGRPRQGPGASQPVASSHGTHVAGTIAAARNGVGIVGVAPNVRLAALKVVNVSGYIYPEYAICGYMWAGSNGMDIANSSYFIDPWEFWCDNQADQRAVAWAIRRALSWSRSQGVVHVAAAGNAGRDLAREGTDAGSPNDGRPFTRRIDAGCRYLPGQAPGVITVSSTTATGALSSFSNFGAGVIDVAAPGSGVLSTTLGGGYGYLSGTSMATPHVSGVVALLKSRYPQATTGDIDWLVGTQAADQPCPEVRCEGTSAFNGYFGEGIVDALRAVAGGR